MVYANFFCFGCCAFVLFENAKKKYMVGLYKSFNIIKSMYIYV